MLDHYRSHQEHNWHKERVMTGMSDKTNNQKANWLPTFQQQNEQRSCDFSIWVERVRRAAFINSTVLALIANMRESVILDFEEWCSNGVFNIKRSEPRTSLQLIFAKNNSLFFLNLYLEVRRWPQKLMVPVIAYQSQIWTNKKCV